MLGLDLTMFFPNEEDKQGRSINILIVKKEVHNDLLAMQSGLLVITLPPLPLVITMLFLVNSGLPDGPSPIYMCSCLYAITKYRNSLAV